MGVRAKSTYNRCLIAPKEFKFEGVHLGAMWPELGDNVSKLLSFLEDEVRARR